MTYKQEQQLIAAAKRDPIYQELLQNCAVREEDYLRIKSTLSPGDQDALDRYLSVCEELEYRRTCLAFSIK